MKPGWKTTEFWLSLAAVIVPAFAPGVTPELVAGMAGLVGTVYTLGRSMVKKARA
jgi:hypothetical protein